MSMELFGWMLMTYTIGGVIWAALTPVEYNDEAVLAARFVTWPAGVLFALYNFLRGPRRP